ncbi:MAG: hypothetical protein GXP09_08160 [Gammaproteobacteria bacterium]|nr:hypothetical protein [Gammaproteobacteria bacterium]
MKNSLPFPRDLNLSSGLGILQPLSVLFSCFSLKQTPRMILASRRWGVFFLSLLLLGFSVPASAVQLDRIVSQSTDDAEEQFSGSPPGSMYITSSDLELVFDGSTQQLVGMRFQDLQVPQGTSITRAYIEFTVDENDSGATNVVINGEDTDNSVTFSTSDNISGRTLTSATVPWSSISPWNVADSDDEHKRTPDLTSIVQEIVDRSGWSAGNAMTFVIQAGSACASSACQRTAESYNGRRTQAARLHVEFAGYLAPPVSQICYLISDADNLLRYTHLIDDNPTAADPVECVGGNPDANINTGRSCVVGANGVRGAETMAMDPDDGTLYTASGGQIYRVDRSSGATFPLLNPIGSGSDGSTSSGIVTDVDAMAFDPYTGLMFALDTPESGSNSGSRILFVVETSGANEGQMATDTFGAGIDYITISNSSGLTRADDLGIDPVNVNPNASGYGRFWISSPSNLYAVDWTSGSNTVAPVDYGAFADGGGTTADMEGLSFAYNSATATSTLYGLTGNAGPNRIRNRLWEIIIPASPGGPTVAVAQVTDTGSGTEGWPLHGGRSSNSRGAGDYEAVECAFKPRGTTYVSLASFMARTVDGGTQLEWRTTSQIGTLGFHLKRKDPDTGKYKRINDEILPALLNTPQGGSYVFMDSGAVSGETYRYKLIEVEATGKKHRYGPFTVTVDGEGYVSDKPSGYKRAKRMGKKYAHHAQEISPKQLKRLDKSKLAKRHAKLKKEKHRNRDRGRGRVKITVKEAGLYYVDAAQAADLLGLGSAQFRKLLKHRRIRLTNRGKSVAYIKARANTGLYFYAEALESNFTDENVYWLSRGKGKQVHSRKGRRTGPAPDGQSFLSRVQAEQDVVPVTVTATDPAGDFWHWDVIIAGAASKVFTIQAAELASVTDEVSLNVNLQGYSNDAKVELDHHIKVDVNGQRVGDGYLSGTDAATLTFSFSQDLLQEGDNSIELGGLLDTGVAYSYVYLDSLELNYHRSYRALNNQLLLRGDGNEVITVTGFSDTNIFVLDISRPNRPKRIKGVRVQQAGTAYQVSFRPSSPTAEYFVVANTAAKSAIAMVAEKATHLKRRRNSADYLLIAPQSLMAGAQVLADYRQAQGLSSKVVSLEDVYNTFGYGLRSPVAIKSMLEYVRHAWSGVPRFVVLVGDGTFDYLDHWQVGGNLLPPLLVATPFGGIMASDNAYADVVGDDGVPEFAIGRIPVLNAGELAVVIDKIKRYEASTTLSSVTMLADKRDQSAGEFAVDSNALLTLLPQNISVDKIYLSDSLPIDQARNRLFDGLAQGTSWLNYRGHGGLDRLNALLMSSDVPTLVNDLYPIVSALTCSVGRFEIPGFNALGEDLVLRSGGGAIAVWAPSGQSLDSEALRLNQELFQAVFDTGTETLGEAIVQSLGEYRARTGSFAYIPKIYILLGDPGLTLRH